MSDALGELESRREERVERVEVVMWEEIVVADASNSYLSTFCTADRWSLMICNMCKSGVALISSFMIAFPTFFSSALNISFLKLGHESRKKQVCDCSRSSGVVAKHSPMTQNNNDKWRLFVIAKNYKKCYPNVCCRKKYCSCSIHTFKYGTELLQASFPFHFKPWGEIW